MIASHTLAAQPRAGAARSIAAAWSIALALASLAGCKSGPGADSYVPKHSLTPQEPGQFVKVAPAGVDSRGAAIIAMGIVAFDEERVAAVIPPVEGRVVRLHAAAGDHVPANAPLATVFSAEAAGAGAGLSQARINRIAAQQRLGIAERLVRDGAGTETSVLEARNTLAAARAEEVRASEALRAIGASSGGSGTYILRAPLAGVVVRRGLRLGAEARPDASDPAFVIADLSHVWVMAYLHESQVAAVDAGDAAEVEVPSAPSMHFEGVVERVSDAVDPNARALAVRIGLDNPQAVLKPDMYVRVVIRTHASSVVVVPTGAVTTQADGYGVFVQIAPLRFERRRVTLGADFGANSQVLTGLQPGEPIVVEGALLLDPASGQLQ